MSDPIDTAEIPKRAGNRGKGRPTLLLDERIAEIVLEHVGNGVPNVHAFAAAGVGQSTVYRWLELGADDPGHPGDETIPARRPRKARSPYKEFREKFTRATAQFIVNHVGNVSQAGMGATTTTTTTHPDGRIEVRTERQPGDWRASIKLLAIKDPANFSEKVIVENRHTGATGTGPVLIGGPAEMVAAMREMTPDQLRAIASGAVAAGEVVPLPDEDEGEDE